MANYDYDIGIIGGGAAGLTVASGASQLGAKTLLIEKEKELGGDCLHFGCVPSKTLIKTAHVYHLMKRATDFGLAPVELPPVDFRQVANRIQSVIQTIQKHDSEERFCGLGAKVVFSNPKFVDDHSVAFDDQTVSAKTWVIASGSSPAAPPIPGLDKTPYVTNKEIFSLDRLPESMIVLGGGPIGTEMSQAFARLGTKVTLVDMADQILPREDRDMVEPVMDKMKEEGVTFYLAHNIQGVEDFGDKKEVSLVSFDGKQTQISAETILVALGRTPNIMDLGLEHPDVLATKKGVIVDDRLRTNQKHIYAIGDVTGQYQFTHAAGYEGGIVVSNAIFRLPRKADYTWLPWCTYSDPELASIGMNEKAAQAAGINYNVWMEPFKDNDRSLAEGETAGRVKMILDKKENPIGVQIVGPHAGDLINEWVAALNGKVKLSTLASAVHPYPTIGEINKRVVGNYFSPKIFSDKVQKGLKFFFNLKGRACTLEE